MLQLNYWSTKTRNPNFHVHVLALPYEFQAERDFCKGLLNSWPDTSVDYLCCSVTVTWYWIFIFFANPLLSEIWWQHHNFSINCRSSKFFHDWKSCYIARHCLPVVIHQREWKLGWQEETFHVFTNLHGARRPGIMQGRDLRVFGTIQWRTKPQDCLMQYLLQLNTSERCRNFFIPLVPGQGSNVCSKFPNLTKRGY